MSSSLPFTKMQALGNDFVLIETRNLTTSLTPAQIRWIADRRKGVGCDQLILLTDSPHADIIASFYNADGSQALACGNGTRCIAKYLKKDSGLIQTPSFPSMFWKQGEHYKISLKNPTFSPPLSFSSLEGHLINVGNPHLVLFTEDLKTISLESLAPTLQPPEGINIELAQIISPQTVRVKVLERGVGITPACGTGACAVGILSLKLGLIKNSPVIIEMEGGRLEVEWAPDTAPFLVGPAAHCFEGIIELP